MKLRKAFSLSELSVVLLVASAVLVGILSVQTSSNLTNKTTITNDRIGQIYKALKVYAGAHKRLPCPASISIPKNDPTYGSEGSCAADTVVYGMVPVKDLNLAAAFAEDDYGNKLVYVVDSTFTVATTPSKFVDQEGDIVVSRYSSSLGVEESNAIFAVISRGKNQRGAVSSLATAEMNAPDDVDELENMPSGSDANLISGSNRSGTTFDDLVFFKNKKYFLADANLTTLQDSNMVGCTSGYTRVGGDCVVQCDVPATIGINSGAKVNQGTNKTLSCNAPNFKTSDSINYSCSSSKLFTNNSGACTCQTGYDLSGSSCVATTCSITGVSGFNNKTNLAYTTTPTTIASACQAGYIGSPTYTCSTSGEATISGTCIQVLCSTAAGTGYAAQSSLPYAAGGTGSFACSSGYSGTKTYTCTSSGAATGVGGTCTPITCTTAAGTGYNSKSGLAYAASGSGSFSCDVAGFSGSINYSCTESGAATDLSGTCAATTCTTVAGTGYAAKSGLAYALSGSGSFPCDAGYSGTKTYTCATSGEATGVSGTCTAIACTTVAGTGYSAKTGLAYAASGSGSFACNTAGYSGTKTYTCTSSGAATGVGGTCTPITCTTVAGTGYSAKTGLAYAASGSGSFACNTVGYTGTKTYTCTATGAATSVGGTCNLVTCSTGTTKGLNTTTVNYGTGSRSCNGSGFNTSNSINYNCSSAGVFSVTSGSCSCATGYIAAGSSLQYCMEKSGTWTLVSSNGYKFGTTGSSSRGSSLECNYTNRNRYAANVFATGAATASGSTLTSSSAYLSYYDCYCATSGCTPSCGSNAVSSGGKYTYQCIVP